jgi:hypothetical protein
MGELPVAAMTEMRKVDQSMYAMANGLPCVRRDVIRLKPAE